MIEYKINAGNIRVAVKSSWCQESLLYSPGKSGGLGQVHRNIAVNN